MTPVLRHIVLIPSFNPGQRFVTTVSDALAQWPNVLVVIDGSTDGSAVAMEALAEKHGGLSVLKLADNGGKGRAVLAGARWAANNGFTHALTMDADGQHPANLIPEFMAQSRAEPDAMILGKPVFPPNVPVERLHWRKLSVALTFLTVLGPGIADPLYGFRVVPVMPLLDVLESRRTGRRYDFDTEAAVRLLWHGVRPINTSAPVFYFSRAEGGVSHFRYLRDNALLAGMHLRLFAELVLARWPAIIRHRRAWNAAGTPAVDFSNA